MAVLDDRNRVLCKMVIWALGEIGDRQAIPALIPSLGEWGEISGVAGESLWKLGAGDVAGAFRRLLWHRDEQALTLLRPHQKAVTEALFRLLVNLSLWGALLRVLFIENTMETLIVPSPSYRGTPALVATARQALTQSVLREVTKERRRSALTVACNAVWALGELGVVEALPLIEKLALNAALPKLLQEECRKVLDKLSALATLPRPADSTAFSTETLPRLADTPKISTEALPCPVPEKKSEGG